jgi:hypothetical protein
MADFLNTRAKLFPEVVHVIAEFHDRNNAFNLVMHFLAFKFLTTAQACNGNHSRHLRYGQHLLYTISKETLKGTSGSQTIGRAPERQMRHASIDYLPRGQRIAFGLSAQTLNSLSNAFASFRSAVSKPSVNQP